MMAFLICCSIALIFVIIGFTGINKKEPVGFWANSNKKPEVEDVKGYNRAVGIMWFVFAIIMALLGIPLLAGQNSPWVFLTVVGVLIEVIGVMVVYTCVIEKKYTKKH